MLTGTGAAAAAERPLARRRKVRRGRAIAVAPDGRRFVVAHAQARTIAIVERRGSNILEVGGQPLEVAISPDGRQAAVTTASWDEPGLAIIDLRKGTVRKRVDAGRAPFGVAFADGGRRLIVSGGDQEGEVRVFDAKDLELLRKEPVGISPGAPATDHDGTSAWVALAGADKVARIGVESGKLEQLLEVPATPDRLAVSPDGRRLLVSHAGLDADHVSELDLDSGKVRRHRAGRLPSAVAWTRRGRRLIALGGSGDVLEISKGGGRKRHRVAGSPRGLAVAGEKAWSIDALTGKIERVGS